MKRLTLTGIVVIAILFFIQSFVSSKHALNTGALNTAANAIECAPVAIENAVLFDPGEDTVMRIRRNIDSLTPAQLESLKRGIAKMKSLPYTDPTSWTYQAAIHGTIKRDLLPGWNSCVHYGKQKFFFLAWHRMFLYFFERILRDKSGDPTLTLPYWDYETKPELPAAFTNKSKKNPLYDGTRNPKVNEGKSIDKDYYIRAKLQEILEDGNGTYANYGDFQIALDGPHGSIHGAVGGNMGFIETAGQDPVFWVHHCNIDRLWGEWLKDHCRHKNSKFGDKQDKVWLEKEGTFFDEKGRPVKLKGEQVIYTYNLKYLYDTDPGAGSGEEIECGGSADNFIFGEPVSLINTSQPVLLNGPAKRVDFIGESNATLKAKLTARYHDPFNFRAQESFNGQNPIKQDKLMLRFTDIKTGKLPDGLVAVYLNLPTGVKPTASSKYFAGLIDLFSSSDQHLNKQVYSRDIDISNAALAQHLRPADLERASITLVFEANTNGDTKINMSIRNIAFLLRIKDQPETE